MVVALAYNTEDQDQKSWQTSELIMSNIGEPLYNKTRTFMRVIFKGLQRSEAFYCQM